MCCKDPDSRMRKRKNPQLQGCRLLSTHLEVGLKVHRDRWMPPLCPFVPYDTSPTYLDRLRERTISCRTGYRFVTL